ncbi:MAG: valine--tRNA ligase [Candidatus Hydrogenedentota bacterium]|nr:MAG: valine--tRNA ligase [Candidatus Hydrogenedentota bacterium]
MAENKKELPPKYNPFGLQEKWYPRWEKEKVFSWKKQAEVQNLNIEEKKERGEVFSMVIPPPNVTGSLHLGHALNHTIQDILARYHRMKGDLTLWVPGTDHAGIATQNVVEKLLAKEGKSRMDMTREEFEKRVWQWKEESGGMITHQQRQLGESVDWDYERFTLDEGCSELVKEVFVRLYKEGFIYRAERIINWCPRCVTALSNIETEYEERNGKLYYIHYPFADNPEEFLEIATTRPETMLGDTAVAVHPDDDRYQHAIGREVLLPLMNRKIPVIADSYVDKDFGTGVVKITPAHDPNDFEIGKRHSLSILRIMDDYGHINENGGKYKGLSREAARKQILEDLKKENLFIREEKHKHSVGTCYRCHHIVEPLTSLQWFVKIKPLAEPAIDAVRSGKIRFVPERWKNVYFNWMENIQDWCISRQLWWGHRIPAYYCLDCSHLEVSKEKVTTCPECKSNNVKQDEDVLDTWFSSALWPFSTLMPNNKEAYGQADLPRTKELSLFYPTSVLVTGFDIIFFWVARMIMAGLHFMHEIPFHDVYIHGLVRDATRQKMSKSKGNVVNPLEKMDEYGTDAFRFFLISILPEGKDIIYDESRLKGYQAFCNKIWNTARFIWLNQPADFKLPEKAPTLSEIDQYMITKFNTGLQEITRALESYRFADYASTVYDLFWKTFCDQYVELAKVNLKEPDTADGTRYTLNLVFMNLLKLLSPAMPFITEELFSQYDENKNKFLALEKWPSEVSNASTEAEKNIAFILKIISKIRSVRAELGVPPKEKIEVTFVSEDESLRRVVKTNQKYILAGANVNTFHVQAEVPKKGIKGILDKAAVYLNILDFVDITREKARIEKEIATLRKGLLVCQKKLENPAFKEKAPKELVEAELQKEKNYIAKIRDLETLLQSLQK